MSKHQDDFIVNFHIDKSLQICKEAISELGWRVLDHHEWSLTCKEVSPSIIKFTWAAEVEVALTRATALRTNVRLNGSIFGFGPVQSGHLKGQVGNLRNRIEVISSKKLEATAGPQGGISDEIAKLRQLHQDGALIDEEFRLAKAKLLGQ